MLYVIVRISYRYGQFDDQEYVERHVLKIGSSLRRVERLLEDFRLKFGVPPDIQLACEITFVK